MLYLEGSTDLAILQAFARKLDHKAGMKALERPLVSYIGNRITKAECHFFGLREACPELRAIAIMDESDRERDPSGGLVRSLWRRREVENYFCTRATIEAFAAGHSMEMAPGPLFEAAETDRRTELIRRTISEVESALLRLGRPSPWSAECKVSDDFLRPLFQGYFSELGEPNRMPKGSLHRLVAFMPEDEIDPEVVEKLDAIASVAAAVESAREEA